MENEIKIYPVQFTTSQIDDLDYNLINILITQAGHDRKAVVRACEFVIAKLEEEDV